jgi:hypothetical protein
MESGTHLGPATNFSPPFFNYFSTVMDLLMWGRPLTRCRSVVFSFTSGEVEVNLRPTASQPVCLGIGIPSGAHDQIFVFCLTIVFLDVGSPLWREDGSVIYSYNCFWAFPEQSLSGPSPAELRPYFTVSFETPSTSNLLVPMTRNIMYQYLSYLYIFEKLTGHLEGQY